MVLSCSMAIKNTVAPAKAGAYVVYRFRLTDAMGPSLRWGDDEIAMRAE